jgi:nitroreductase/NAD-dependent dihydropyrimidine dehydrogenase PreA subunit
MMSTRTIDRETCNVCGACADVCPANIMIKHDRDHISFCEDRIEFCIGCGQCMAVCPTKSIHIDGLSYDTDFTALPVGNSYENAFFDMITSRRAIRSFKDKPVPKDLLEKIVNAVTYAPPSSTPIKTEVVVVQDTSIVRQALPHMIALYNSLVKRMGNPVTRFIIRKRVGAETYRSLVNHIIPVMKNRLPELKAGIEDTITRYAPSMIIFHADRNEDNYRADAYIAVTYAFLAAHTLGLGGSVIGLIGPAIDRSAELRKLFSIPDANEVVTAMILGYPKHKYQRLIKRQLKSVTWI